MEFTLEDFRVDPEKYRKQIPKYDRMLFDRYDLDKWSPEDYPIVKVELGDEFAYLLSLLRSKSKMFRYSRTVFCTGYWFEIPHGALFLEKIIVDSDTHFEIRFGEVGSSATFSFSTKNREFSLGAIPLKDLTYVSVYFRFPRDITVEIVYDEVANNEWVPWVYLDRRLFEVGDHLMVYYAGLCGKVEDLYGWPNENGLNLKPVLGTRRRCLRYLAMMFFEEVGVSPDFIAAE